MAIQSRQRHLLRVAVLFLLLAGTALLTNQAPAEAHGYILRSFPQDQAVLARAPTRVQVWFSENLEPRFSTLSLTNQKGESVALSEVGVSPANPTLLAARISSPLPDGAYVVTIRAAFASDGHIGVDSLIFWVGQQTGSIAAKNVTRSSSGAVPLEVIWRALTLLPLSILFGTLLLYQVVLVPGWGNPRYRAGGLAPRVMSRLNLLLWIVIVVAGLGCILALLQQAMALFSTDLSVVLRNGLWSIVLLGTQFGGDLQIRLLLLIVAGVVQAAALYLSARMPGLVAPLWALNTAVAGLILSTMSIAGHAAGSTLWPVPSVFVDWLHLLAEAAWIGGLVGLAVVLPAALAPLGEAERRMALLAVLRRFSRIGVIAVALLAATGLYNALLYVQQPSALTATSYGQTLILKVILILPLLLIALYHHAVVADDWLASLTRRLADRLVNLTSSVRLESSIGLGVILVAALLTATPPPVPPDARGKAEAPSQTQTVGSLGVNLSIDPGTVGGNSYEVDLSQGEQPLAGAQVWLRFVDPVLDKRSNLLLLDDVGDGSYVSAGADLERSGEWQAQVDVLNIPGRVSPADVRAVFRWNVPDVAPDTNTRQPSSLNWFSVAATLAILGIWLIPGTVRKARSLHVQAEIVVAGVMGAIATLVLLILGGWLISQASQRTDALRNPTPVVVNPALADAGSLAAGKAVYETKCEACHGASGVGNGPQASPDTPDLRLSLPTRRDEDLYRLLAHSGSGPDLQLSEAERWNVINYLRSPDFALVATATPGQ